LKIFVGIDDTDSLDIGATGQSANELRRIIMSRGWGQPEPVTRHQLLLHPDIPYTSHNSSMCFAVEASSQYLPELIRCAQEFLESSSAPGSDPGLCVAADEQIRDAEHLISFGFRAKREILRKEDAYQTALHCGLHLSEHGGTGLGVIGALAGLALRLTGNDGRFQGKIKLRQPGAAMSTAEILASSEIEEIQSIDGQPLVPNDTVIIGEKIKTVLLDGKRKLLVYRKNDEWHTITNQHIEMY